MALQCGHDNERSCDWCCGGCDLWLSAVNRRMLRHVRVRRLQRLLRHSLDRQGLQAHLASQL